MSVSLSIVVPAYNAVSYLEQCIDSILKSDYTDFEILLVDDGSTDGTSALCDQLAQNDPRLIVLHQENQGLSSARNTGLNHAKGKYVSFVDADDIVHKKMFSSLVLLLEKGAELAACRPFFCIREETDSQKQSDLISIHDLRGADNCLKAVIDGVWVWNKLYNRNIIEANHIRFRKECIVSEDQWFNTDYISKISYALLTNEKLYYHIQTPGSCMSRFRSERNLKAKYIFIPRGWEYTAQHFKDQNSSAYYSCKARAAMFYQTVLRKLEDPSPEFIQEAVSYVRKHKGTLLRFRWGYKYYLSALVLCLGYPLWATIFRRGMH